MQENKNLVLAVVLCLIVLFGWNYFAEFMGWVQPVTPEMAQKQREIAAENAARREEAAKAATLPTFTPSPGKDFRVDTPLYEAVFYTGGGPLRSFRLKKYHDGILANSPVVNMVDERTAAVAPMGLVINSQPSWSTGQWALDASADSLNVQNGETAAFAITGLVDNLRVIRQFTIDPRTYLIREKTLIANESGQPRSARVGWTAAMDASRVSGSKYDAMSIAWDNNGTLDDESSSKTLETTGTQATGKIYWGGAMSTYFLSAVMPQNPDNVTIKGLLQKTVFRVAVEADDIFLEPGQRKELETAYWIGPKDRAMLDAASDQLVKSIDLGFFSVIAKGLLWLLEFFHQYVHNWGVAIILLTFLIKGAFWPLTAKSYASMEKMKQLQPLMLKIREKYKDNKEEMNKEVMALYRNYKVNPASGCVPILIQLPVFFGLYQALLTSIALRHASFITYLPGTDIVWLADLSDKDPLYITPIIMGMTMFLQQKMSPPPADPTQAKVMMFLPLIFTVLFLNFPSGLVIYWLVNNILSILQQWLMMHKLHKKKPTTAPIQNADAGGGK